MEEEVESAQADQSSSSDYESNDTPEEIEMALKHGLDYKMPEEETTHTCTSNNSQKSKPHPELSKGGFVKPSNKLKPRKQIPTLIKNPPVILKSHISTMKIPTKQDFAFKVPCKSAKDHKTTNFKNIFSPVALYINNSPKVPQVQHVPVRPWISSPPFLKPVGRNITNKENDEQNLPNRLYKPAKHTIITSKKKELKLSGSIQKHIMHTPAGMRHQGRFKHKKINPTSVEDRLLNEDLTMCHNDVNFSNSSL